MDIEFWPHPLIAKFPISPASQTHLSVLLSNVTIAAVAPFLKYAPHVCLARFLLHIPCPGCGITHAVLAAERLQFLAAWHSNPAGLGFLAAMCFQFVARPIAILRPAAGSFIRGFSRILSNTVWVSLFLVWTYRLI
jgi:hypothetical protein